MMKQLARLFVFCLLIQSSIFAAERPNIVLIISDDQGWTDYGFMGHKQVRTPNLDRLASQSLTFPRGYVPTSLCCPSLASMITGQFPHQTKITGNEPPLPAGLNSRQARENPEFKKQTQELVHYMDRMSTLPRRLSELGYVSFQTGKWWQGNFSTGGFTHGMSQGDPEHGGRHGDEGLAIGRKTMQPIYDFVETATKENKPFFVWYAPMMPHQAHNPPQRILKKYLAMTNSVEVAKYWGMCEWFDETCGQLMNYLDEKNLSTNTIVVYVTDNGWIQNPNADKPREDSKLSQYDGGVRTPIMVRWPGHVKARTDNHPVSSIDIAPTLLRAVGLKPTKEMQGINLLDASVVKKRDAIFGECFLHNAVDIQAPEKNLTYRWCISDDWKLIIPKKENVTEPNKPGRKVEIELYNLKNDPFEETNLAEKEPKRVAAMTKQLNAWWPAATAK